MNGGVIPHHQQTAYDRGYEDGLMERARWLPLGMTVGVVIGGGLMLLFRWIGL